MKTRFSSSLTPQNYQSGVTAQFIESRLAVGQVAFALEELLTDTGLSLIAARNQLLRLGSRVRRVMARQPFYIIVSPEHQAIGAPPPSWWLDAYFQWMQRPYYVALLSAASEYGATAQAIQVTQVVTSVPHRDIVLGRVRVQFFVKHNTGQTPTLPLVQAQAPLALSTPEATALDLIAYSHRLGGVERAAETIVPMLHKFKRVRLTEALRANVETAHAQRLGFILERNSEGGLANVVEEHLRSCKAYRTLLEPSRFTLPDSAPAYSKRWKVLVNTPLELQA